MNKQKIIEIVCLIMAVICFINWIYLKSESNEIKNNCKALYEKEHITAEDLKTKSTFRSCVTVGDEESSEIEAKYRKLYGVEHIGSMDLSEYEGVDVICSMGDARILITDEAGTELFYESVSELYYEPGPSGKYDIWVVGKNFSGEVSVKH